MHSILGYSELSPHYFELDKIHGSNSSFAFNIVCDCFDAYVVISSGAGSQKGCRLLSSFSHIPQKLWTIAALYPTWARYPVKSTVRVKCDSS